MDLKEYIKTVEDFPKPGVSFKDIAPLVASPSALKEVVRQIKAKIDMRTIDKIVGFDARGFLFGPLLSVECNIPFVMLRKKGKLPGKCTGVKYDLEYGSNELELQINAISKGDKVLLIDDLLATGGTAKAGCQLVEQVGGVVECVVFIVELSFLEGRDKLKDVNVISLIEY